MLLSQRESVHWYTVNGEPRYDATLREARRDNLLPSITTIEKKEITSHNLYTWAKEQLIMSALTLPRAEGESMDAFASRVVADSSEERNKSAVFGTKMHDLIDCHLTKKPVNWSELDAREQSIILPAWEWIDKNLDLSLPFSSEKVFTHHGYGYAGRIDFTGYMYVGHTQGRKRVVIDWKTQYTKNGKTNHYDTWAIQLAAQESAVMVGSKDYEPITCMNVIISTKQPGLIEAYIWSDEDIARYEAVFRHALQIFQLRRKLKWDPVLQRYL